jgi:hypothetical protein
VNRSRKKRIFILGAGCSANYGYPLGGALVDELVKFGDNKLSSYSNGYPFIRRAVASAISLAEEFPGADTLDKLVSLAEERYKSGSQQEEFTDTQILDAKIAVSALFLEKESEARKSTLKGYEEYLLPSVFGGDNHWPRARTNCGCCVLTFNYDRLFEIAFLDYFRSCHTQLKSDPLYGKQILNSGIGIGRRKPIEIEASQFCFLKLHGSVGLWARMCKTNQQTKDYRDYGENSPHFIFDLSQLEQQLKDDKGCYKWEPLIAFPHEKQRFMSDSPGQFVQGPYIGKVWDHAATILQEPCEVTVIGYSFAPLDRDHVVTNLLRKAPPTTKIKIENKCVNAVRKTLESYSDLQPRLEYVERCF